MSLEIISIVDSPLKQLVVKEYKTLSGKVFTDLKLSYQTFGKAIGTAPIVLINHALTGNSNVAGTTGWWRDIVGKNQTIDTNTYSILAFNIPGNGYDNFIIENYKAFVARDIARLFLQGLAQLEINQLFAIIGGSLGGGIAWEMVAENPELTQHLIPIASDWKSTDWMVANCQIQEQILNHSSHPVNDARMHAMLCYRTPQSFKAKFNRTKHSQLDVFNVEHWLLNHGEKLQERFQVAAYKLVNQLLKSIDATKGKSEDILNRITANIHVIGIDSDLFFTAEENKDTVKILAQKNPNVTYHEIQSEHGHDAFLIEYDQLQTILSPIFNPTQQQKRMKILKFGGQSLANGKGINRVIEIISEKHKNQEKIAVVVSARGNATNQLESILDLASDQKNYDTEFSAFEQYQTESISDVVIKEELQLLKKRFEGISLTGDFSEKVKDEILAQGEIISAKTIAEQLKKNNINAHFVDTRSLIKTDDVFGNAQPLEAVSRENVKSYFKTKTNSIPIVTGFIGSNADNKTTTLGRNGSNYTASLLANYLDAEELLNYTHVNGIYTADPSLVENAKKIDELTFNEANEIASIGTTILHAKTIIPLLEKNINLRILNTFNDDQGTLITAKTKSKGIKSITVLEDVVLLNLEGRGLLEKPGVDARIFNTLAERNISISIISQGSSERGIGLIIKKRDAKNAVNALESQFEKDVNNKDVNSITVIQDVAVISIIGLDLNDFHNPFNSLIKNQIQPLLLNNTVTGKNISIVVNKLQLHKALNVVHGEIFGVSKIINIAIFGHGLVGKELINQILASLSKIETEKGIKLNIFAVANSKTAILNHKGISDHWVSDLSKIGAPYDINGIIAYAKKHHLANLIAVDNTASNTFIENYKILVQNGFDLVSSNKVANTISLDYYNDLRNTLKSNQKNTFMKLM